MSFHLSSLHEFTPRSSVFKRCMQCSSSAPPCPSCSDGEICTMISQSCNQCATTKCIKTSSGGSGSGGGGSGGGSNAGAIAGGVIGGVAFVGIVTFLVWWFVVRKKRAEYEQNGGEKRGTFAEQASARKSTNSIASTVLTRASNVIQIAYIPGVTNRSPPETPGSLVPPVPPLPGAAPDQHFFMPGDLRDSTWTNMTDAERRSVAPTLRSSVATTIYRNDAIVSPMPAQQIMRARANVVSVHNGNGTETVGLTAPDAPAVPAITQNQLAKAGVTDANNSSIVARGVTAKPVVVKGGVKKINNNNNNNNNNPVQTIEEQSESNSSKAVSRASSKQQMTQDVSGFDASSDEESDDESPRPAPPTIVEHPTETGTADTSNTTGPFKDQPTPDTNASRTSFLSEHSNRSSKPPPRGESPFSDVNEVK